MSEDVRYLFPPPDRPALRVRGSPLFVPIRRVYCVGRNFREHAVEMGGDPVREPPFFFAKPADAVVPGGGPMAFPASTSDLHHEVELVLALGGGGRDLSPEEARDRIAGYAVGIDLTRRDLQRQAKESSRPWDMAKGFDRSAPCSDLALAVDIGHPRTGEIRLTVNGTTRQRADLADMVWSPEEALAHLSELVELAAGDLLFTGTPAGVGRLEPGDEYLAEIAGVGRLAGSFGPPAPRAAQR